MLVLAQIIKQLAISIATKTHAQLSNLTSLVNGEWLMWAEAFKRENEEMKKIRNKK